MFGVLAYELLGIIPPLPEPFALVGEPGAALIDELFVHCLIDQVAFIGNALVVQDVEFGFAERRRHLVFHDLDTRPAPDRPISRPLSTPIRRMSTRMEE